MKISTKKHPLASFDITGVLLLLFVGYGVSIPNVHECCDALVIIIRATWQPHKNNTAHQKHMRSTWVPRVFTAIRK
jgi:hypothetical protein